MDVLAHTLWANVMFRVLPPTKSDRRLALWGALFGVLPDLISFVPAFAYVLFIRLTGQAGPNSDWPGAWVDGMGVFKYAETSYNYTHSFVTWAVVIAVAWAARKKFPWILLGALLHIFLDLFTHPDFYRTPFLHPLTDYKNPYGISWGHPIFMAVNYGLLVLAYAFLFSPLKKFFEKNKTAA